MRTLTATVTITITVEDAVIIGAGGTVVTPVTTASISVSAATERVEITTQTIAHLGAGEQPWSMRMMTISTFPRPWAVCQTL